MSKKRDRLDALELDLIARCLLHEPSLQRYLVIDSKVFSTWCRRAIWYHMKTMHEEGVAIEARLVAERFSVVDAGFHDCCEVSDLVDVLTEALVRHDIWKPKGQRWYDRIIRALTYRFCVYGDNIIVPERCKHTGSDGGLSEGAL